MQTVTIVIMDKEYRIQCQEDEEAQLKQAAEYLNNKITEIKKSLGGIGTERIAIMAAINLCYEYLSINNKVEKQNREIKFKVDNLLQKVTSSLVL